MSDIIAVTELEYRKAEAVFQGAAAEGLDCRPAPAAEEALAAFIRDQGANHAVIGVETYRGPLYAALPRGGVIARFGVGHDGVDQAQAAAHGLFCTNTPGVLDDSVAEFTLALLLAAARHLAAAAAATRAGGWTPRLGCELRNRTLAVIGCGAIGRRVARGAAAGFGMRVIGCDPAPAERGRLVADWGFEQVVAEFATAVAAADFVSLHLPSIPATRHFINAERLALLRPEAVLVNTARGALVDEGALYAALAANRLAGAALDVFEQEPYVPESPGRDLRTLPNVLMTPHLGSSTAEACGRMARAALANIRNALAGNVTAMTQLTPGGCMT
ncbi:MAG: NAD(P)-dependent oxidoreductase [Lentisphaeria bacterium]